MTTTGKRAVYMRLNRRDVRQGAIWALALAAAGAVAAWHGAPGWIWAGLLIISGICVIGTINSLLAFYRNRRRQAEEAVNPVPEEPPLREPGDVVTQLDLGVDGMIDIVIPGYLDPTARDSAQQLARSVASDPQGFRARFAELLEKSRKRYPEHAREIQSLRIREMFVLPADRGSYLRIGFKGELGDVWRAEYDGTSFEFIWIR